MYFILTVSVAQFVSSLLRRTCGGYVAAGTHCRVFRRDRRINHF